MKNKRVIIKNVLCFVLGGVVFGVLGVYAATTLLSQSVYYNNSISGGTSTNVKGALDELYTRASKWINTSDMGIPTNYIANLTTPPSSSSPTTPPSGKNVYLGLYADEQYGVCINKSGTQHCFRANNWIAESKHIQKVFSDASCNVLENGVTCEDSVMNCMVLAEGFVACNGDFLDNCAIYANGSVSCGLMN